MPVDHYLPRSAWPELAIVATNLVPSCDTCNTRLKKTQAPGPGEGRLFLHPYFDHFITGIELLAKIDIPAGASAPRFEYSVAGKALAPEQESVMSEHFRLLNLDKRYCFRATQESLATVRSETRRRVAAGDWTTPGDLSKWLAGHAETVLDAKGALNWETAITRAFANSQDFAAWLFNAAKPFPVTNP